MSVDFQTEIKDNYVLLSCNGTLSNDALLNVYETAFDIAENNGLKAILVDISNLEGALRTWSDGCKNAVKAR